MSFSYEDELEEIRLSNNGRLLPEQVVEYARENVDSDLHRRFDWDDSEAAEKWRIVQARELIRVVIKMIPNPDKPDGPKLPIRTYISLPTDRVQNLGYRAVEDVLNDSTLEEEMLAALRAEVEALQNKYKMLRFTIPLFKDFMDRIKKRSKGKRPDPEHRPQV